VKAFVVCESMFGNAEKLPMAVPEGLVAASAEVAVVEVRRAGGQDLMVPEARTSWNVTSWWWTPRPMRSR
jgi:hypothetical protein